MKNMGFRWYGPDDDPITLKTFVKFLERLRLLARCLMYRLVKFGQKKNCQA